MGRGEEKAGLMANRWMTLALIVVVLILLAVLIYVFTHQEILDRFKKKRPPLKPGVSPTTGQRFQSPGDQPELVLNLRSIGDGRPRVVAELSWQESAEARHETRDKRHET